MGDPGVLAAAEPALSAAAVAANMLFAWPQALRVVRSRSVAGVSPGSWAAAAVMFGVWASYAAQARFIPLLVANLACLAAAAVIMEAGVRLGWPAGWPLLSAAGVLLAAFFAALAPAVLAVPMIAGGVLLRLPQLRAVVRSSDVSGVSWATWMLAGATAALWFSVAVLRGDMLVAVANLAGFSATVLLLALLWRRSSGRGFRGIRPAGMSRAGRTILGG